MSTVDKVPAPVFVEVEPPHRWGELLFSERMGEYAASSLFVPMLSTSSSLRECIHIDEVAHVSAYTPTPITAWSLASLDHRTFAGGTKPRKMPDEVLRQVRSEVELFIHGAVKKRLDGAQYCVAVAAAQYWALKNRYASIKQVDGVLDSAILNTVVATLITYAAADNIILAVFPEDELADFVSEVLKIGPFSMSANVEAAQNLGGALYSRYLRVLNPDGWEVPADRAYWLRSYLVPDSVPPERPDGEANMPIAIPVPATVGEEHMQFLDLTSVLHPSIQRVPAYSNFRDFALTMPLREYRYVGQNTYDRATVSEPYWLE